ncbi:MAG: helix-turn-helix transcriptional regulator [Oligoflexia bacterium]|nr:helix-turn-helix transcriptional regulator [Oligoflexia bacterium]
MTKLSKNAQKLFRRAELNPVAAKNLHRSRMLEGIARQLRAHAKSQGVTVRELAERMGTSKSQAQRVLAFENASNITIATLLKAADALELDVDIGLKSRQSSVFYHMRGSFPTIKTLTCFSKVLNERGVADDDAPQAGKARMVQ